MHKPEPQKVPAEHAAPFSQPATTTSTTHSERRNPRRFYIIMGSAAVLVVVVGFSGSFYGVATGTKSMTPLVQLHAAVFSAWLVLYLVQTGLVASGRTALHRQLGITGLVLAVAVVGVGCQTAITAARRGYDITLDGKNDDPLRFLVFTLGDLLSFAILIAAALWYRQRPEVHKRLMLLATVGPMMSAALVHVWVQFPIVAARPPLFLASMASLLFAGAVYDRVSCGRFHPVSLRGAVILFVWGNVRAFVIGPSAAWHRFAEWLIR